MKNFFLPKKGGLVFYCPYFCSVLTRMQPRLSAHFHLILVCQGLHLDLVSAIQS